MSKISVVTKQQAVKYHRELWNWLMNNPDKNKQDWPEWNKFTHIKSNCFACEISEVRGWNCICLFDWGGSNKECGFNKCIWDKWLELLLNKEAYVGFKNVLEPEWLDVYFYTRRRLARDIRDLLVNY